MGQMRSELVIVDRAIVSSSPTRTIQLKDSALIHTISTIQI